MQKVYGYVRVSTTKQGDGVSLEAQQESIQAFAQANNLLIIKWFKEKQTAAKVGRIQFNEMLDNLSSKKAQGVIFHKIDRSTRNHSDWSKLVDLRDFGGISFYFSADGIDMESRSGRFIADINVAMAKHYIDNLREEVLKGLYGRLKQGFYPFKAPIGYLDTGKGNPKAIDPIKAPIIKEAFRLCAEEKYTLNMLRNYLAKNWVTTSTGVPYGLNSMHKFIHNPFYMGLMKVKDKLFEGKHEPIVSVKMYQKAQEVLAGKHTVGKIKNNFLYRKELNCNCGRKLIGEKQKGRVYYRCHNKKCSETTIREDRVTTIIFSFLKSLLMKESMLTIIESQVKRKLSIITSLDKEKLIASNLRLSNVNGKLAKLTDSLLEGIIENSDYTKIKNTLLIEKKNIEESKQEISVRNFNIDTDIKNILELPKILYRTYLFANDTKKKLLLKKISSNLFLRDKKLIIEPKKPLNILLNYHPFIVGDHSWNTNRNMEVKNSLSENFWWIDREMNKWRWLKSKSLDKVRMDVLVFGLVNYIINH